MNIRVISNKSKDLHRSNRQKTKKENYKNIVILFLCFTFLMGIIAGSVYFKFRISDEFLEENINFFEKSNIENLNIDKKDVFIDSLLKNIMILVFFWIVGLSIVGVPILVFFVLYEGFSVAITIIYTLLMIGVSGGYGYIYSSMYITTLINVLAIIFLCNSAIRVTVNVLKHKSDVKTEFVRHSAVCLIVLVLFIISSLNEAFISEFCKEFIIKLSERV